MPSSRQKLLFSAIQLDDKPQIQALIEQYKDDPTFLQTQDEEGNNVIAFALKYARNIEAFNMLLQAFSSSDLLKQALMQPNHKGAYPLIQYHYIEDPSPKDLAATLEIENLNLRPPFEQMLEAIQSTHALEPKDWIEIFNLKYQGNTALHLWVMQNNIYQVHAVLDFIAPWPLPLSEKIIKKRNAERDTPLSLAIFYKHFTLVKSLQKIHQHHNDANKPAANLPTVLNLWAQSGKAFHIKGIITTLKEILSPEELIALLNSENEEGKSLLGFAIYYGQTRVVDILIGEGAVLSLSEQNAILPPKKEILNFDSKVSPAERGRVEAIVHKANDRIEVMADKIKIENERLQFRALSWHKKIKQWFSTVFPSKKTKAINSPIQSISTASRVLEVPKLHQTLSHSRSAPAKMDPFDVVIRLHAYEETQSKNKSANKLVLAETPKPTKKI